MGSQEFNLKWNNHYHNLVTTCRELLTSEVLVDVTLSCEGQSLKAHKLVLSMCSTFFKNVFLENPCQHPVIILKGIKYNNLKTILKFMYHGEVSVSSDQLTGLIDTADYLQVKGLTGVGSDEQQNGETTEENVQRNATPSSSTAPLARPRYPYSLLNRKRKRKLRAMMSSSFRNRGDDEHNLPLKVRDTESPEIIPVDEAEREANANSPVLENNAETELNDEGDNPITGEENNTILEKSLSSGTSTSCLDLEASVSTANVDANQCSNADEDCKLDDLAADSQKQTNDDDHLEGDGSAVKLLAFVTSQQPKIEILAENSLQNQASSKSRPGSHSSESRMSSSKGSSEGSSSQRRVGSEAGFMSLGSTSRTTSLNKNSGANVQEDEGTSRNFRLLPESAAKAFHDPDMQMIVPFSISDAAQSVMQSQSGNPQEILSSCEVLPEVQISEAEGEAEFGDGGIISLPVPVDFRSEALSSWQQPSNIDAAPHAVRKQAKKGWRTWSRHQLQCAVNEYIAGNMNVCAVAKKWNIPKSTLHYKIKQLTGT